MQYGCTPKVGYLGRTHVRWQRNWVPRGFILGHRKVANPSKMRSLPLATHRRSRGRSGVPEADFAKCVLLPKGCPKQPGRNSYGLQNPSYGLSELANPKEQYTPNPR